MTQHNANKKNISLRNNSNNDNIKSLSKPQIITDTVEIRRFEIPFMCVCMYVCKNMVLCYISQCRSRCIVSGLHGSMDVVCLVGQRLTQSGGARDCHVT